MYLNPGHYLNGTAAPSATGLINQCNADGSVCALQASPDSFLWSDALHPSEQADRNLAMEL
jgi:phospholipase/lecithinase/hemolysin